MAPSSPSTSAESAAKELPYVFELPENDQQAARLFDDRPVAQITVILERLRILYDEKLQPGALRAFFRRFCDYLVAVLARDAPRGCALLRGLRGDLASFAAAYPAVATEVGQR